MAIDDLEILSEMMKNQKKTVMIVDDDPDVIFSLQDGLESLGTNVEFSSAENGSQALSKIAQNRPDVILLDIMMPVMDGLELAKQLKEYDTLKEIPLIFLTAVSDKESKKSAEKFGEFIQKPYKLHDVHKKVGKALAK